MEDRIKQLEAENEEIRKHVIAQVQAINAFEAENLQMRKALDDIAHGCSISKDETLKAVHERARTTLKLASSSAHLAKKIELMEKVILCFKVEPRYPGAFHAYLKELDDHEAKAPKC